MTMLSQHIERTQAELNAKRDKLAELSGGEVLDLDAISAINAEIGETEKTLGILKESEARSGAAATGTALTPYVAPVTSNLRPASPAIARRPLGEKELSYPELLSRSAYAALFAHAKHIGLDDARQRLYGDHEQTRKTFDVVCKAASSIATTTTTHWAAELVATINGPMTPGLYPMAIYPSLSSLGQRLTFPRGVGTINIPTRDATPTIAGSFVAEGAPIPVRQGSFTSIPVVPKKMAVISSWSREIDEMSEPAIRPLIQEAILQDTSVALDTILIDQTASSSIRPAGLRNGVSAQTATTGGGFTAMVGDISKLVSVIVTATNGNIRNLVFLMNPAEALKISLMQPSTTGLFPFKDEINNNRLIGYPVIQSGTVPAGTIICLDAADFVSISSDSPRFEVSDQATLHMEDTTPLAIGTVGSPATVAAPARSLFQTDSMALRMILPMNWVMRRTGVVSWVTSITW